MNRLCCVIGTSPELYKMIPIIQCFSKRCAAELHVVFTGQHANLPRVGDSFLPATVHQHVLCQDPSTLNDFCCQCQKKLEKLLSKIQPKIVAVHGDTISTFAGAMAAYYNRISLAHIEAGLRSFDLNHPYPEEGIRRMVDCISDYLFTPTSHCEKNLINEKANGKIVISGNSVIDMLTLTISAEYSFNITSPYIVVSMHRRESWGDYAVRFADILIRLAKAFPQVSILFPLHDNPLLRKCFVGKLSHLGNVVLTEKLPVKDIHNLIARALLLLTDSGGLQEEGVILGKHVYVYRETTERPEGVKTGFLHILGRADMDAIFKSLHDAILRELAHDEKVMFPLVYNDCYGRSGASEIIANALCEALEDHI
jgi:UDP-N-acetylglucosamine 2-epimerase (non-hydrolysing)